MQISSTALWKSDNLGIEKSKEIADPFPTSLAHSKVGKRARREHSEYKNESTDFPHAGVEGHDGGKGERQ